MDFGSLSPLEGGWSGETFLAEAGGEQSVVRLYTRPSHRGVAAPEVDAALLQLVGGLLPVPQVLELRHPDDETGMPAVLVTSFLPGERVDLLLPRLDPDQRATLGGHLGELLADLAGMPMLARGAFVDARLGIGSFPSQFEDLTTLVEYAEPTLGWWTPQELAGLRELAVRCQDLLDTVTRHCLVHGDFNAKNLLADPAALTITGLVDWEYAHAGHPYTDLGNLLRFEQDAAFTGAVLQAWVARRGGDPASARALGQAADLPALIDLAQRRSANPVAEAADRLLRARVSRLDG